MHYTIENCISNSTIPLCFPLCKPSLLFSHAPLLKNTWKTYVYLASKSGREKEVLPFSLLNLRGKQERGNSGMCWKANPYSYNHYNPLLKAATGCGITFNLSYFVCTYVEIWIPREKSIYKGLSVWKSSQMCSLRQNGKSLILTWFMRGLKSEEL